MEVILLEKIQNLGSIGDLVKVRQGYARNFLIPQGKAIRATEGAKKEFEERREELLAAEKAGLEAAQKRANALNGARLEVQRRAAEDGKLFGSVTNVDIVELLEAKDLTAEKSEVQLPNGPLKETGEYEIVLILHPEVEATIVVEVAAEEA